MKRITALICALALAAGLVACGPGGETEDATGNTAAAGLLEQVADPADLPKAGDTDGEGAQDAAESDSRPLSAGAVTFASTDITFPQYPGFTLEMDEYDDELYAEYYLEDEQGHYEMGVMIMANVEQERIAPFYQGDSEAADAVIELLAETMGLGVTGEFTTIEGKSVYKAVAAVEDDGVSFDGNIVIFPTTDDRVVFVVGGGPSDHYDEFTALLTHVLNT